MKARPWIFNLTAFSAFLIAIAPQESANPLMIAPFIFLSLYLLLSGRLSNIQLRDPVLLCVILLWLGWSWGTLNSAVPFASQVTWLILSIMPVTYLCACGRDIRPLLYAICVVVTVLAAATFFYMFVMRDHYWRARLFFDDENILGALIAGTIPLTLSLCFLQSEKKLKLLCSVGCAVLIGGLALTQSRSAFIGAAIGVIPVIIKNRKLFTKNHLKIILPVLVFCLAGIWASGLGHRLWLAVQLDKDVIGRFSLWKSAFEMSWLNPVDGVGLGIFHLYYPPFKMLSDNSTGFWVHMDPLQWVVETGVLTGIAFYALAACVAYRCLKQNLTPLQIGAGASLLSFFVTAHAGYVFHYVPILIFSGLLLSQFSLPQTIYGRLRYIPAASFMVTILCGVWLMTQIIPTLYMWTIGINSYNRGDLNRFTRYMEYCIDKGSPGFPGCRIELAKFNIDTSAKPDPKILQWLEEVDRSDPMEKASPYLRARYDLKIYPNRPDIAVEQLKKSLLIDPSFWNARQMVVSLLMNQGKNHEAFDTLEIARKYQISSKYLDDFYKLEKDLNGKINP